MCNSREVETLHSRKPICLATTAGAILTSSLPPTFCMCLLVSPKMHMYLLHKMVEIEDRERWVNEHKYVYNEYFLLSSFL